MPPTRAGDYAQAMMDLGAGICTPKRPACCFARSTTPASPMPAARRNATR